MMAGERERKKASTRQTLLALAALAAVILSIGAGYLIMGVIAETDRKVSAERYRQPGRPAQWQGDRPADWVLASLIAESRAEGDGRAEGLYAHALASLRQTGQLPAGVLPPSPFLAWCTLGFALAALALLLLSRRAKRDVTQTAIGIVAGLAVWVSVELGLMLASRRLGIVRGFDLFADGLVGVRGEFVLLKYSWVFLLPVVLYLLFQESVRCNLFVFLRRRLHLMRGAAATGRIDNYAPRVAFFYTSSIWTFYVILLWLFDEGIFGLHSWGTYSFFVGCLTATVYLFHRLLRQGSGGALLRYAIAVALVLWSCVEILMKWGFLPGLG